MREIGIKTRVNVFPGHCMVLLILFAVPVTVNEDIEDISIRKAVHHEQLSLEEELLLRRQVAAITSAASSTCSASDDDNAMVVDMRQSLHFHNSVRVRQPGLTERDVGIDVRVRGTTCTVDDLADLHIVEELVEPTEKLKGCVSFVGFFFSCCDCGFLYVVGCWFFLCVLIILQSIAPVFVLLIVLALFINFILFVCVVRGGGGIILTA